MDMPGIIRLSTQEARAIKDLLLAHRDNLDTRYRTRIEFGANPDGREMLDIKDQKRRVSQSLKLLRQRLQDEELVVKIYEQSKKSWRKNI